MRSNHNNELIVQYLDAYNAFDIEGMLAVVSQDVRFENYSGGHLTAEATGKEEFKRLAEYAKSLFSEREQRVTALDARDGTVVAAIAYRGRLAADVPNGPQAVASSPSRQADPIRR